LGEVLASGEDDSPGEVGPGVVGYAVMAASGGGDAVDVLQKLVLIGVDEAGVQ
jgi:hypothetical protein